MKLYKLKVFLKAKEIEKILIKLNKNQSWLAYQSHIGTGYMSQLMDGTRNPSPKLRQRLMINLPGYNFDDLFEIIECQKYKCSICGNKVESQRIDNEVCLITFCKTCNRYLLEDELDNF